MNNSNLTAPSPGEYASVLVAFNIVTFVIGLLAIVTNGILLIITVLDPLRRFKTSSSYFIISLALSDFLTGIASCLFAFHADISKENMFKVAVATPIWISVQNSVFTIFLMAIERYIVIRYPLNARRMITKRRTKFLIALTWVASIGLGSTTGLPVPYGMYGMLGFMIECLLFVLVMLLIYARIIILLKSSLRQFTGTKFRGRERGKKSSTRKAKDERNLNIVVFSLAVILCVTVIPHWGVGFYYIGSRMSCANHCHPPGYMLLVGTAAFAIELLNFALNPLVYAWRLPAYRRSIFYYFTGKKGRYRSSFITSFNDRTMKEMKELNTEVKCDDVLLDANGTTA